LDLPPCLYTASFGNKTVIIQTLPFQILRHDLIPIRMIPLSVSVTPSVKIIHTDVHVVIEVTFFYLLNHQMDILHDPETLSHVLVGSDAIFYLGQNGWADISVCLSNLFSELVQIQKSAVVFGRRLKLFK